MFIKKENYEIFKHNRCRCLLLIVNNSIVLKHGGHTLDLLRVSRQVWIGWLTAVIFTKLVLKLPQIITQSKLNCFNKCMIFHIIFLLFADCGSPPVIVNAAAPVYFYTLLGSTATYTCNTGFGISGPEIIRCLSSGWEAAPQCVTGTPFAFICLLQKKINFSKCTHACQWLTDFSYLPKGYAV